MSKAIEQLAAELMKLSNDEWTRVTERWRAGQEWSAVFGPAWDEISERLSQIDWDHLAATVEDGSGDALPRDKAAQEPHREHA
jgi:hypothetical protein